MANRIEESRVECADGKYAVVFYTDGTAQALRYVGFWPGHGDHLYDNLALGLARDLQEARKEILHLRQQRDDLHAANNQYRDRYMAAEALLRRADMHTENLLGLIFEAREDGVYVTASAEAYLKERATGERHGDVLVPFQIKVVPNSQPNADGEWLRALAPEDGIECGAELPHNGELHHIVQARRVKEENPFDFADGGPQHAALLNPPRTNY